MKFTRIAVIALMATGLISSLPPAAAFAQSTNTMEKGSNVPVSTQDFVKEATIGNTFEIQSSKLALKKSHDKDIRSFAQHMIDDHTKAGKDMKMALNKSDIKPAPMKLDTTHEEILTDLKKTSARNFDAKYVAAQTSAHDETIALFTTYSQQGNDPALKEFATSTLPTLEQHKQAVTDLQGMVVKEKVDGTK